MARWTQSKIDDLYDQYEVWSTSFDDEVRADISLSLGVSSPAEAIAKAIEWELDTQALDFDESDIPVAPNFIEYQLGAQFAAKQVHELPMAAQAFVALETFGEVCYGCSDVEWYFSMPVDATVSNILDKTSLLENGVCPRCDLNTMAGRDEFMKSYPSVARRLMPKRFRTATPDLRPENEAVVVCGQRSGKTVLASMVQEYQLHRVLTVRPSPSAYWRQMGGQLFLFSNVAVVADQARTSLWAGLRARVDNAPWFQNYHKFLRVREREAGHKLLHDGESLQYRHKAVHAVYQPAKQDVLRGGTRPYAAIDEFAQFDAKLGDSAKAMASGETYVSLSNSLMTLRLEAQAMREENRAPNPVDGIMFNIGSPYRRTDPLVTLLRENKGKTPRVLTLHRATWEMNPKWAGPQARKDLYDQCKSKATFNRDFGAEIPDESSTWLTSAEKDRADQTVLDHVKTKTVAPSPISVTYRREPDEMDPDLINLWAEIRPTISDKWSPRILACDMGHTNNSFVLTLGRVTAAQTVIIERAVECTPLPGKNGDPDVVVHHPRVYKHAILPLVQALNIEAVLFDQWQSIHHMQDLRSEHGVDAQRISPTEKDVDRFKEVLIGNARLTFAAPPLLPGEPGWDDHEIAKRNPEHHLQWQIRNVEVSVGRQVKPYGGTDDLLRSGVLITTYVFKGTARVRDLAKKAVDAERKLKRARRNRQSARRARPKVHPLLRGRSAAHTRNRSRR